MDERLLNKSVEIEGIIENELDQAIADRDKARERLQQLLVSKRREELANAVLEADATGEEIDEYVEMLNEIRDLNLTIELYDRVIIMLELGYDPLTSNDPDPTDMDVTPDIEGYPTES